MQRWLARELCFHRDPSLIRFYTGFGARGLLDQASRRRHLTVRPGTVVDVGGSITEYVYDTPGSYNFTVPVGTSRLDFRIYGAGGAGGVNDGGGGGGGACCVVENYPFTSGETISLNVGKGGGQLPFTSNTGGTSNVKGVYYIATGGGVGENNGPTVPGAGGISSGGTFNHNGQPGSLAEGGAGGNNGDNTALGGGAAFGSTPNDGQPGGGGGSGSFSATRGKGGHGKVVFIVYMTDVESEEQLHIRGLSNNSKHGLMFAPQGWHRDSEVGEHWNALQRVFDPRSSHENLNDVCFGVHDDFTVLCWVNTNKAPGWPESNELSGGPLMGVQGQFQPPESTSYGVRGWTFGVQEGAPYLKMYSNKFDGDESESSDDYGHLSIHSDIGLNASRGTQQWSHVACVFQGSKIPWGRQYSSGGLSGGSAGDADEYVEVAGYRDVGRRPFISFFHNGSRLENISNQSVSEVYLKKTSDFVPGPVGAEYPSGYEAASEPVFSVGSEIDIPSEEDSGDGVIYNYSTAPACLFRIYNRALSPKEIQDIYSREQFLFQYRPYHTWPAEEMQGIPLYLECFGTEDAFLQLFMHGHDDVAASTPLFVDGVMEGTSASVPVFISGQDEAVAETPLFTQGYNMITTPVTLFVSGVLAENKSLDLFVEGCGVQSQDIPLYTNGIGSSNQLATLFIEGTGTATHMPLFTHGSTNHGEGITLFTSGVGAGKHVELFIAGGMSTNQDVALYVEGAFLSANSLPLYLHNNFEINKGIPLFLQNIRQVAEQHVPCFIFGSHHEGVTGNVPLYVHVNSDSQKPICRIPLFLQGVNESSYAKRINLFISGEAPRCSQSVDLLVWNDQEGVTSQVPLFISGDGVTEGALPFGKGVNLFIRRNPGEAVPLFLQGPGQALETPLELFMVGGQSISNSIDLSLPNVIGFQPAAVKLFTTGF